jgi:hypothetical protein
MLMDWYVSDGMGTLALTSTSWQCWDNNSRSRGLLPGVATDVGAVASGVHANTPTHLLHMPLDTG